MSFNSYSIELAELGAEWDLRLNGSVTSSIFISGSFLKNINRSLGLYYIKKSNEIVAQIALVESDDGKHAILDDLVVYSGVSFCKPKPNQNRL